VDTVSNIRIALESGHVGCLDVLLEHNDHLLHANLILDAASLGYLHIVQYLHERGCPWDEQVLKSATALGYWEILSYAIENGCDCPPELVLEAVQIVSEGGLQCLKYLIEHRALEWPAMQKGLLLIEAFIQGNYFAVEFLLHKGPGFTLISDDVEVRASWRPKIMMAFYNQGGYDLDLSKCIDCALQSHFNVVTELPELVNTVTVMKTEMPPCAALLRL